MNRNTAIDLSRAIAVILVTMSHVSRGPLLPSFQLGKFDAFGFLQNGWIGVGIFFVISGYCMGISSRKEFNSGVNLSNYLRYSSKRLLRILPPYYISILIWFFIINNYHIAPKPTGFRDILTHLTFTHNFFRDTFFSVSGVYWSIAVEIQFYLILPLILVVTRETKINFMVLIFFLFLSIIINHISSNIVIRWSLLNYLVLFIFGLSLFKHQDVIINFIERFRLLPFLVAVFVLLISYKGKEYSNDQKLYETLSSTLYGFIMLGMSNYVSNVKSILIDTLLLIGKASFSIYLYNYIYNVVSPRSVNFFAMIFMMLGTLAFGVIMYIFIEYNSERFRAYFFKRVVNKNIQSPK